MPQSSKRGNFTNRPDLNPPDGPTVRCEHCGKETLGVKKVCCHCGHPFNSLLDYFYERNIYRGNMRMMLWKTVEGEHMHVSDMDTDHVLNCVKLLVRRGWDKRADLISKLLSEVRHASQLRGKDALLYAAALRSGWIEYMSPVFYVLLTQLQARGVNFGLNECHRYFDKEVRCSLESLV